MSTGRYNHNQFRTKAREFRSSDHATGVLQRAAWTLHLEELTSPEHVVHDHIQEDDLERYAEFLQHGLCFGVFVEDELIGFIIAEPQEWNNTIWYPSLSLFFTCTADSLMAGSVREFQVSRYWPSSSLSSSLARCWIAVKCISKPSCAVCIETGGWDRC